MIFATAAPAEHLRPNELARAFAICEGRFDALATRQRALNDSAAPATEAVRLEFAGLSEATSPPNSREATLWHAGGWVQMAGLLARMDQTPTPRHARQLRDALETCRQMVHF